MSKSELHTILSSVQMSPVDRKRLVNYLNNFKNNQQQGTNEFIIKYNYDDGSVDVNFDDLKVAVLNKNNIVIETGFARLNCFVIDFNENAIRILSNLALFLDGGVSDNTKVNRIGFSSVGFIFTKDKTKLIPYDQVFIVNGNGDMFLADDGTYYGIDISTVNGLSARLQSIENRIKALEDAANA